MTSPFIDVRFIVSSPGYISALPSSQSLPTLPFSILEKVLKLNPVSTTNGAGLRHTSLDIGVVHLLLTCLGLLSHHEPRKFDSRQEATLEALKVFNVRYVSPVEMV